LVDNKVICGCDVMTQGYVVPFDILNAEQERSSKEKLKLTTIILVLLISFVLTNAMWIYYFNQYEAVEQSGCGENNYGTTIWSDLRNGTSDNQENQKR
jgi:hypothetical protein